MDDGLVTRRFIDKIYRILIILLILLILSNKAVDLCAAPWLFVMP